MTALVSLLFITMIPIDYKITNSSKHLSYSMVVCIGIIKVWVSCPKMPPTNQPNIYFVTAWQHWLGITKPKNIFRLTLTFLTYLTDWLTIWLTPSDKHSLIASNVMGLISSLFNVASSRNVPFCQLQQLQCLHHGSTKAYLCSPLFSILFSTTV